MVNFNVKFPAGQGINSKKFKNIDVNSTSASKIIQKCLMYFATNSDKYENHYVIIINSIHLKNYDLLADAITGSNKILHFLKKRCAFICGKLKLNY